MDDVSREALTWAAIVCGALIVIVLIIIARGRGAWVQPQPQPVSVEVARFEETAQFTGGGAFAVALLMMFNVIMLLVITVMGTVFQQIVAGVIWIAGNQVLTLCCLCGRRSSLVMRRWEWPQPPPEAPGGPPVRTE